MRGFGTSLLIFVLAFIIFSWSIILYPDFYEPLRKLGLPIPYCFTEKIALNCRYTTDVTPAIVSRVIDAPVVYVSIPYKIPVDVANDLCNSSQAGNNVIALISDENDLTPLAEQLVSCGVKVRRYPNNTYLIVSNVGLVLRTDYGYLYTDCNDVVTHYMSVLHGRWSGA